MRTSPFLEFESGIATSWADTDGILPQNTTITEKIVTIIVLLNSKRDRDFMSLP